MQLKTARECAKWLNAPIGLATLAGQAHSAASGGVCLGVHRPLAVRMVTTSRTLKIRLLSVVSVAVLVAVVGLSGPAGAAPQPTPAQARKELAQLNAKA